MKTLAAGLALWTAMHVELLAKDKKPERVPIFVAVGDGGGFTDPSRERNDSAVDIVGKIKGSKILQWAQKCEGPVLIVQVLGRETTRQVNLLGAQNRSVVRVRLVAGDFRSEFEGTSSYNGQMTGYSGAASGVVKQLEQWVEQNRARLSTTQIPDDICLK